MYKFVSLQYLYDFLEAVITRQTSPEEAYRKLDEMASRQTESLRKLTKQVRVKHTSASVEVFLRLCSHRAIAIAKVTSQTVGFC